MNRTLSKIRLTCSMRYQRRYGTSSLNVFRRLQNSHDWITFKNFQIRGQFNCVYRQMGYEAPLSPDDRKVVLDKLNNLPPEELSRFLSKSRSEVLVSRRPFEVVEQLLDLKVIY
jgi:hypothetical protein